MPTRIDKIHLEVALGGADISNLVLEATVRLGFDLRVSECELLLRYLPDAANFWDPLIILAGLDSTGSDTFGAVKRFDGYLYDLDWTSWPGAVKLIGRGPLILASTAYPPTDDDLEFSPSSYEPPGYDLSIDPDTLADWTATDAIKFVLQLIGLDRRVDLANPIGGNDHKLGLIAYDQFYWKRGQDALAFIEELDTVSAGFRTFEILGGSITRANTSPRAPFDARVFDDLQEGRDVGFDDAPATVNRRIKDACNRAAVTGYDGGGGPVGIVRTGASDILPPGQTYVTTTFSSPMLEQAYIADGEGSSCEEIALWLLDEHRYPMMEATVPTWRDDPFSPGQVLYLNAPSLQVNQAMWLKTVEIRVNATSFTQTLTLFDRAQRDLSGNLTTEAAPLMGLDLPAGLPVNP